ncbi:MAG: glycosyltransferase [Candidatus Pacebacteria bacterium]|nr:glycosyltransferase [Candidatus Paceibacterota bacterium]
MKISVIIPCYNEADSIGKVLKRLPDNVEAIVVDNNSTDDTAKIARQFGAKVYQETTQGYGAAIKHGLKKAQGDILVVIDGDGQYPVEAIPDLVNTLEQEKLDFISAARFPLQDKTAMPFVRRFGNWGFNLAARIICGLKLQDSQSGMWVFRRSVLGKINPQHDDMPFSEEIKILAAKNKEIAFAEKPISYAARTGSSKLVPWKHGWMNLKFLFQLRARLDDVGPDWLAIGGLVVVLLVYILLSFYKINTPFIHVSEDTAGANGIAAMNLDHYGWFNLKFGFFDRWQAVGLPYTHHPQFFLLPTAIFYGIFGVNEVTTRLGLLSCMIVGLAFFYFALLKISRHRFFTFLTTLIFALLPGMIYYGRSFEITPFTIPTALISFSLLVFYAQGNPKRRTLYLILFWLSVMVGGLFTWFYYFFAAAWWVFILLFRAGRKTPGRKHLLISIPIALVALFALNLLHFYILRGPGFFADLKGAYGIRVDTNIPFSNWLKIVVVGRGELNYTWLFLIAAGLGFIWFLVDYFSRRIPENFGWLFVWIIAPLAVAWRFYQWITHPFGVIVFAPAVAIFSAYLLYRLYQLIRPLGLVVAGVVIIVGAYLSWQKLDFFYNQFLILGERDMRLLKELAPTVQDDQLCLGDNQFGLGYNGIVEWYLRKRLGDDPQTCSLVLLFRAGVTQEFFDEQAASYSAVGFNTVRTCGDFWCLLEKTPYSMTVE